MLAVLLAMTVLSADLPQCDTLMIDPQTEVVEIGTVGFSADATIEARSANAELDLAPCGVTTTASGDALVVANLGSQTFGPVWYVANPETAIANADGVINGGQAFQIDSTGTNAPLLFESLNPNGLLEPNEVWAFRVTGFTNATLGSDELRSPNQVGVQSTAAQSSGSIVGVAVVDSDGDGVPDVDDNCPRKANPDQAAASQGTSEDPPGSIGCACLCGDVTGNCIVNASDANEIQRAGVPLPPISGFDPDFCDVNGNGTCNAVDGNEIQRYGVPLPPVTSFSLRACAQEDLP